MPLTDASSYPLWANALLFAVAGAIVWFAGTRLSRYLGEVSEITGIEQATVGMLMLGTLTSLPEIANVATSSYFDNPALAANNLLGSASINVVLLAVIDVIFGRDALTASIARPSTLLQSALCMMLLILVALAVTTGDVLFLGIGAWPTALFALSLTAFWLSKGYSARAAWGLHSPGEKSAHPKHPAPAPAPDAPSGWHRLLPRIAGAALLILIAGYTLSQSGDAIAHQTGLGAGLVGFLLIGFATSLPELSSISTSVRMRRHEMAIGEVLGTNFVNISLLLLADAVFTGEPVINVLGRFEAVSAMLGALLVGVYLVGLLERRNPVILRMGYDSLVVLLVFAGGVMLLFAVR